MFTLIRWQHPKQDLGYTRTFRETKKKQNSSKKQAGYPMILVPALYNFSPVETADDNFPLAVNDQYCRYHG